MEITVISRQTIKPSSPTPPQFKYMKLSLLDQLIHSTAQARMLFFYSSQGDLHRFRNTNMSERLKRSLSQVLTEYYPLAGRYHGTQTVECNDDGLEYIEARVKAPLTLNQLVTHPTPEEHDQLLPYDMHNYGKGFKGLSAVQVTLFDACGGMTIGISVSHLLADASSLAMFINRWATIARSEGMMPADNVAVTEKFSFASVFPPRDIPATELISEDTDMALKWSTKRFIFPQSKLDLLKSEFQYQSPTRVEAVAALIFSRLINISKRLSKSIFPGIAIDLRARMNQRLPENNLGNMSLLSLVEQISPEMSLNDLGVQLRGTIREIDGNYIGKLQADNGSLLLEKVAQLFESITDIRRLITLSSCCNFPFYKVDFGWGTPTMIAPVLHKYQSVLLLSRNHGDGIEAWVTLAEDDMTHFQCDAHILKYMIPQNRFSSL